MYAHRDYYCSASAKLLQLRPTFCNPMDCSPPGSFVMGFSRQEYWSVLLFPYPGKSSWCGNWTQVACIASRFFIWAVREALLTQGNYYNSSQEISPKSRKIFQRFSDLRSRDRKAKLFLTVSGMVSAQDAHPTNNVNIY